MLVLSSDPSNVAQVQPFVEKATSSLHLSKDTFGNILISLTEAVTNAIRHGNGYDETKKVMVDIRRKKNKITCYVSDEGQGFDIESIPDPTAPENLLKCGGRGVFLMHMLSDEVEFKNNGSTVEMRFKV